MNLSKAMNTFILKKASIAPLAFFRIAFGLVMCVSMIRFLLKGWLETLYIQPKFFFPYFGFEWVKPLEEGGMYSVFILLTITALFISIGFLYRISSIVFFIAFTYVELIDKSNYLNHYYFISIISFLLCLVPAANAYSLDVKFKLTKSYSEVPVWCITIFKLQLSIVYFYAGIAKLTTDWLWNAMPLRIWLPAKYDLPLIGSYLDELWVAYFFSWAGMLYDLLIPFILLWKRTTYIGIILVIVFHILTSILFPMIGMFPFIMLMAALIFLPENFHLNSLKKFFVTNTLSEDSYYKPRKLVSRLIYCLIIFHFILQVIVPLRFLLYPGKLFWTEEGYRFSWRVMLMEKAGYATFIVKDVESGKMEEINNGEYLSMQQEKMMSTQPDMILQYAKLLEKEYINRGVKSPQVIVESYVTLNGRSGRLFIDPSVDLTKESEGFRHKKWILSSRAK